MLLILNLDLSLKLVTLKSKEAYYIECYWKVYDSSNDIADVKISNEDFMKYDVH